MSFKSTVGHLLNDVSELVNKESMEGYVINSGVDHGLSKIYYGERLIELPFLFRSIKAPPLRVLDIGCSESSTPIQLAMMGYDVVGIDLRNYRYRHRNFKFVRADFLKHNFEGRFDVAIDISAIEHFGLAAYRGAEADADADKKAVRKVHRLLGKNGQFIFTAPFGVNETIRKFERIYDSNALDELLSGFERVSEEYYVVKGHMSVTRIAKRDAAKIRHSNYGEYAVVLVDARKA